MSKPTTGSTSSMPVPEPPFQSRIVRLKVAAAMLGIGCQATRDLVHARLLPTVQIPGGRGFLIDTVDIEAFIASRKGNVVSDSSLEQLRAVEPKSPPVKTEKAPRKVSPKVSPNAKRHYAQLHDSTWATNWAKEGGNPVKSKWFKQFR